MAESNAFPWLKHLPEDAQREFFEELSEAFGEAQVRTMPGVLVSPATYVEVLDPLLAAWRATAEVHSDPELYKALTQDHGFDEDDFVLAHRPGEPCPDRCHSNTPDDRAEDSAHWCALAPGHAGVHTSSEGFTWTDKDAEERNPGRKPLSCGWCFEEPGEEVHPHPECPVGRPDGFDVVLGNVSLEDAEAALKRLYGGDWDKQTRVIPQQRDGGTDCV
jgi:hypothetical protein